MHAEHEVYASAAQAADEERAADDDEQDDEVAAHDAVSRHQTYPAAAHAAHVVYEVAPVHAEDAPLCR